MIKFFRTRSEALLHFLSVRGMASRHQDKMFSISLPSQEGNVRFQLAFGGHHKNLIVPEGIWYRKTLGAERCLLLNPFCPGCPFPLFYLLTLFLFCIFIVLLLLDFKRPFGRKT